MLNASLCTQIIWNDSPVIALEVQKGGLIVARVAWWWSGCLGVQYSVIYRITNWRKCGCENIEHTEDFGAVFNFLSVSVGICEIFNDSLCRLPSHNTDEWLISFNTVNNCLSKQRQSTETKYAHLVILKEQILKCFSPAL